MRYLIQGSGSRVDERALASLANPRVPQHTNKLHSSNQDIAIIIQRPETNNILFAARYYVLLDDLWHRLHAALQWPEAPSFVTATEDGPMRSPQSNREHEMPSLEPDSRTLRELAPPPCRTAIPKASIFRNDDSVQDIAMPFNIQKQIMASWSPNSGFPTKLARPPCRIPIAIVSILRIGDDQNLHSGRQGFQNPLSAKTTATDSTHSGERPPANIYHTNAIRLYQTLEPTAAKAMASECFQWWRASSISNPVVIPRRKSMICFGEVHAMDRTPGGQEKKHKSGLTKHLKTPQLKKRHEALPVSWTPSDTFAPSATANSFPGGGEREAYQNPWHNSFPETEMGRRAWQNPGYSAGHSTSDPILQTRPNTSHGTDGFLTRLNVCSYLWTKSSIYDKI
ncbi:hypothetical protein E2P81_ATG01681 [Venturia nashicola]|nr:hypothetical protein E2P81_ATG01681 [Venturia nashicola]